MKEELGIRDYLMILSKRRVSAIVIFTLFVLVVTAVTFTMTPVYKATAQVYIESPNMQFNIQQQQQENQMDTASYLQTQMNILKSDAIARTVIAKLHLDQVEFGKKASSSPLSFLKSSDAAAAPPTMDSAVPAFEKRLNVEVVKNSNLVNVSYETQDPELAAAVANETVQVFIDQNIEMRTAPAKSYMTWLDGELDKIKNKMNESSDSLENFKRSRSLIGGGDRNSNVTLTALNDLNARVLAATAKRYEAEIKYQQVMKLSTVPGGLMSLPDVINNKLVQDLKTQEESINKDMAEKSKKFGDKHPVIIGLNNEMAQTKRQINSEVKLIVNGIKNDYEASLREESSLQAAFSRQKAEAMSYDQHAAEYEVKKEDMEGAKDIYQQVLKKAQETTVMGTINVSNVQLFDKATPPKKPSKPKKALNVLLGIVLGLFTGVGFALVSERMDNTYTSPEELEEHLGVPMLGIVPKSSQQDDKKPENIVAVTDPISPMAESFRTIRSNILLSRKDRSPRVIQVCSALHGEGKSTVSINLACIMAAAGERILLIDGDMRRPRLHKVFEVPNSRGLSSVITKKAELADVLKKTGVPNLTFIPSGPLYSNPGEMLGSTAMFNLIAGLREQFDRVLIDCPPYLGIADASLLTPLSDGVVLVVRSGSTIKDAVWKIKKNMDVIKAEILGVVLNDMTTRSVDYYYHYNYTNYISTKRPKAS
ncbi:MAG: polysaccharide biosynthesis tyrosine autokinase [Nitrospirota bacterium]